MNKIRDFLWKKLDGVVRHTFLQQVCRETQEYADKVYSQPTSGKQEQWTVEIIEGMHRAAGSDEEFYSDIAATHESSITAERERMSEKWHWHEHWQKVAEAHNCQNLTDAFVQLRQLREQLADTWNVLREFDHTGGNESLSECAGVAVESYNNLKHQLAAAQAAIAEVEDHNIRGAIHPDVLAKHIAEAQKPLVDALNRRVYAKV